MTDLASGQQTSPYPAAPNVIRLRKPPLTKWLRRKNRTLGEPTTTKRDLSNATAGSLKETVSNGGGFVQRTRPQWTQPHTTPRCHNPAISQVHSRKPPLAKRFRSENPTSPYSTQGDLNLPRQPGLHLISPYLRKWTVAGRPTTALRSHAGTATGRPGVFRWKGRKRNCRLIFFAADRMVPWTCRLRRCSRSSS